jgi:4-hydroxybenzoate polyprenyltransferase
MFLYLLLKQWYIKKNKVIYWKEVFIAAGYALGVLIPVFSMINNLPEKFIWMYCYIFCVAFINVLVIGYYEKDESKKVNDISLCHFLSVQSIRLLSVLLTIIAVSSLYLMNLSLQNYIIPLFIAISLLLPLWNFNFFRSHFRYKNWEDGVFMISLLFCL